MQYFTHLLFLCANQFLVVPVLQFPRSLGSGNGGMEDEEFAGTFCRLEGRHGRERKNGLKEI